MVAGLHKIGRHRASHIAEADKSDVCHVKFLRRQFLFPHIEHEFVGADLGEIRRDHFLRHLLDP